MNLKDIRHIASRCVLYAVKEHAKLLGMPTTRMDGKKHWYKPQPVYYIVFRDCVMTVIHEDQKVDTDKVVYKFTPAQTEEGLTFTQWQKLYGAVARVFEGAGLYDRKCITNETPSLLEMADGYDNTS